MSGRDFGSIYADPNVGMRLRLCHIEAALEEARIARRGLTRAIKSLDAVATVMRAELEKSAPPPETGG